MHHTWCNSHMNLWLIKINAQQNCCRAAFTRVVVYYYSIIKLPCVVNCLHGAGWALERVMLYIESTKKEERRSKGTLYLPWGALVCQLSSSSDNGIFMLQSQI